MSNPRLEELRSKFQENPRRYFAPFANELRKAGDPAQAIAVCRAQLASQPGHVSGHIVLGQALYEAGEKGEARTVFTAALELDPENLIALRTLGEIAQVNGEFGGARRWYQRLLDADPRNHEVSQLLRDLPEESTAPPAITTPNAVAVTEEPTPKTVHDDIAAGEPSAPARDAAAATRFNTGYTGAMPAYDPDRFKPQPAPEPVAEPERLTASSGEPFIDLQPMAHDGSALDTWSTEPVAAAPYAAPDAIDVVDTDQAAEQPAAAAHAESSPDELLEFDLANTSAEVTAESAPSEAGSEIDVGFEVPPPPSAESVAQPTHTAPPEPPHAVFAERGFDGPVNEDIGWLTTPSATYSDLEAAPEDWFEGDEQTTESPAETSSMESDAPEVTASAPTTTGDSWFDEADDAQVVESAETSSDDFWLPPELPRITSAAETPEPVAEERSEPVDTRASEPEIEMPWSHAPEPVAASAEEPPSIGMHSDDWAQSEADAAPEPVTAALEQSPGVRASLPDEQVAYEEPAIAHYEQEPLGETTDVRVIAEASEDAIFVEHHAEPEPAAMEAEPVAEFAPQAVEDPVVESTSDMTYASASFEIPPVMDAATVLGHTPEPPAAITPLPFVTETLADLYLQQGFKDEALSIYRQLVERNPDSQSLKDRIEAIEKTPAPAEPAVSSEEATERAASQSVRTFFSRLARRQATNNPIPSADADTRRPEAGEAPFANAASALANMFAASKPSTTDESAASSLAGAFSDSAGRPSRTDDRELSLDHLFRDVAQVGSQGASVTLDEFYSTPNASAGSSTEPAEERSDEPGGSDIRQFTAWLEGLRKK